MTVRAYIDAPVPIDTLSDESKKRRLLLERKNVDKVTFNNEFVDFYIKDKKETFGIGDSCIEIIQGVNPLKVKISQKIELEEEFLCLSRNVTDFETEVTIEEDYKWKTFEALTEKMLENVSDKFDKREGSVIYDAIAPAALELANFYIALDMAINEIFADSASYYYLVKRAAERGLYPKAETNAILQMKVTPKSTPIAVNDRFNLSDSLNYTVTSIINADEGIYQVECETAGIEGNQHLGEVIAIETENDLNNMEKAILTEVLVPGEDEEDVETFRERYFASFDSKAFGGNRADYKEKINNISGVGGCKVIRAWENGYNPSGMIPTAAVKEWVKNQSEQTLDPEVYQWLKKIYDAAEKKLLTVGGTVKAVVITSEYKTPSDTLIDLVQNTLDPEIKAGEGDGIAPIGHIVNVFGVKSVRINISANITYEQGYSFQNTQEHIHELLYIRCLIIA